VAPRCSKGGEIRSPLQPPDLEQAQDLRLLIDVFKQPTASSGP
jgi:hypothetical protein